MPQARDQAGNIWETDEQGNAVRLLQPASSGQVFTLPPNPKDARQEARANAAEQRAEASAAREAARFAKENVDTQTPGDTTKTGDEYLATLPAPLAAQVKALSEGRRAFPTGAALRSPQIQELVAAAAQYDPSLDAANAATRVATRKDFTSGKAAQNITAINTALGHLGTLSKAAEGLDNRSFPLWNSLANTAETATGDPRVKNFKIARDAVANELMRVFRGTGGSLTEIEEWKNTIGSSDSPEQLKAEIGKAVELLNSRLEAVGEQYSKGMGKSADPMTLLNPHAQKVFNALGPGGSGKIDDEPPPNDPGPGKEVATGHTRNEFSPRLSAQIDAMVNAGASKAMIDTVLKKQNYGPIRADDLAAAKRWMKENPGKRYFGAQITKPVPLSMFQRFAGSAPAAAAAHAADMGTAGLVGAVSGETGRGALDAMSATHPTASLVGDLTGGIIGAAGLEAGVAARAPASLVKYAPRVADFLYGGLTGFNQAEEGEGAAGAGLGALAGLTGGVLGNRITKGLGVATKGVTNPAVQRLRAAGVPMTVGQVVGNGGLVGRGIKGVEDALTSVPGVGNVIDARRLEGIQAFADKMANDAVAPIGGSSSGFGQQTVDDLLQQGSDAYTRATAGAHVPLDPQFTTDITQTRALGSLLPDDLSLRFNKAIDNRVDPILADSFMTGDTFQQGVRGLKNYRAEATKPGFEQDYRDAITKGIDALRAQMERGGGQDVIDNLADADQAWKGIKIFQKATEAARNGARSGEVGLPMPSHFNDAATAAANKFGGSRFNGELIDAAQSVLPSKLPDSGTWKRLLVGGAATGTLGGVGGLTEGAEGAGYGTGGGLLLAAALAAGGSKPAQRALTSILVKRPDLMRIIGDALARNSGIGGTVGAGLSPLTVGP